MRVQVSLSGKARRVEVGGETKVIDLIEKLKINPETVIVKRGKEILLETDKLRNNDKIEMIRIISGG